ncbi:MAG: CpaE family protein [Pseudolabrys sp.]
MGLVSTPGAAATRIVVVSDDAAFGRETEATFGASRQIEFKLIDGRLSDQLDMSALAGATVIVADIGAAGEDDIRQLARLMTRLGDAAPVIAVTQSFDAEVARRLLQMRVGDFLVKPVAPIDLVRACGRVANAASGHSPNESQIYTFLPSVGGAGVTTLAVQTAMLLLGAGGSRGKPSVCLVDLDLQHGAVADHLDLEPRLNLDEVEPRPERLDRQLLEVMLSHHASGLAVVAAPNRPADMRSFDPDVVTRLLDLVSANFDYVVIDMPRTWFSWTDSVLLGSNRLFIVSETTVPALRHAKQLVAAVRERLADGPKPEVLVNRFEQRLFTAGLKRNHVEQALGGAFAGSIPNDYALVREAIDRGVPLDEVKPGNKVTQALKKIVMPQAAEKAGAKSTALGKFKLAFAR